jgi:hypothetical protein
VSKSVIDDALVKAIHDYLMSKPMREVEGLVNALRAIPPLPEPKQKEK